MGYVRKYIENKLVINYCHWRKYWLKIFCKTKYSYSPDKFCVRFFYTIFFFAKQRRVNSKKLNILILPIVLNRPKKSKIYSRKTNFLIENFLLRDYHAANKLHKSIKSSNKWFEFCTNGFTYKS